jgi:two-component system, NarL family, sensor kinase
VPERSTGTDPSVSQELRAALLEHAHRGLRLQVLLRGVLVAFVVLTIAIIQPAHNAGACAVLAGGYAAWAATVGVWSWRGASAPLRSVWLALFVDLAVLAGLTLLAGASANESWTADVLVTGFLLVPLLAATQLRPDVSAVIVAPTVVVYFAASAGTRSANAEPWSSVVLRALVLLGVGLACVALSWIQRSRVLTIGGLLEERTALIGQLMSTEDRERQAIAEQLHDGALQYLLAARHDLEAVRELGDPDAFVRLDRALHQSARLLRSTVSELHPAVLANAGLARALRELAEVVQSAGQLVVKLDVNGWDDRLRTSADVVLYAAARELLANVVKHAGARTAQIRLAHEGEHARLTVADDGRGIAAGAAEQSLAQGHIGLASHRARVEAAGGTLTLTSTSPSGTLAQVQLRCRPLT